MTLSVAIPTTSTPHAIRHAGRLGTADDASAERVVGVFALVAVPVGPDLDVTFVA